MVKISAVVNTKNEAQYLKDCLKSLNFVDEIVVVDMESEDKSRDIAYKFTSHVYLHQPMDCVEKARNFALHKATGNWILVVDPDEVIPQTLASRLVEIADQDQADFVRIPRQNIIFNQWIKHSRWWPDHNIRFFKKGRVEWQNTIHSIPVTYGNGLTLEESQELSIIHHHYSSISQYFNRAMRYSDVQAQELLDQGYRFSFLDALNKPLGEFLSRFFAGEGYKDGFHGLVLALLQAFSTLLVYLKVWEQQKFKTKKSSAFSLFWLKFIKDKTKEFKYWQNTLAIFQAESKYLRFWLKIKRKLGL